MCLRWCTRARARARSHVRTSACVANVSIASQNHVMVHDHAVRAHLHRNTHTKKKEKMNCFLQCARVTIVGLSGIRNRCYYIPMSDIYVYFSGKRSHDALPLSLASFLRMLNENEMPRSPGKLNALTDEKAQSERTARGAVILLLTRNVCMIE